jgi:uncharacterized lipoprotein YajG
MRLILVLAALLLMAGCQSSKKEPDYSTQPKQCDQRAVDSGLCVPGEYEDSE